MTSTLDRTTIEQLSKQRQEPGWLTDLRLAALKHHAELPWPHPSDEIWRRTDVTWLDPAKGFGLPSGPGLFHAITGSPSAFEQWTTPFADESLIVRADGAWVLQGAPAGVTVKDLAEAAQQDAELVRQVVEADGFTPSEQKLTSLNAAFHHDGVVVRVAPNLQLSTPIRLVHLLSARPQQTFVPMTIIVVGEGSTVVLVDEYVGLPTDAPTAGGDLSHVVNSRIELLLEPNASLTYVRIQRWQTAAKEFVMQRATLSRGANFTLVNLHLGASISKSHVVTRLMGEHASSQLYGFAFGHGRQHVDQHSLQDHQAPHTTSDLLFKAALKDESRMIYTGLIRIAKAAKQTNAYQANHNLLLSQHARAETIPMLEILADDVSCKHGATIGPVDEEQLFYLMTRGIRRELAERLLVMGFVDPIIQRIPYEPLQNRLRDELEGSLLG